MELQKQSFRECSICPSSTSISIFTDVSWCFETCYSGLGFIVIANLKAILVAGSFGTMCDNPTIAEYAAMNMALQTCEDLGWKPDRVFCDCPGIQSFLKKF